MTTPSPLRRTAAPLLIVGVLGLVLSACGTSAPATAPASAAAQSSPSGGPQGTSGTIAAVGSGSLEVQNPRTGQVTVDLSGTTTITRTVAATAPDVAVGDCVAVATPPTASGGSTAPAPATGPVAAASVTISQAIAQGCRAGGGSGGTRAGIPPTGVNPTPGGGSGGGRGRGTFGKVTALGADGFTVQGAGTAATATTVTTSSTTTYTRTEPAGQSALVIGQCATAVGPADDTGTVTASSVSVRAPGANGCTSGFGGNRGGQAQTGSGAGNG